MKEPKLEVMICTCGEQGLDKVAAMTLPSVDGVGYLVSCQSSPRALPSLLRRDDLRVVFTDSKGLSNNRNNALAHVRAPYAVVADDDLNYYTEGLRQLLEKIDSCQNLELFTFVFKFPYKRIYPIAEQPLTVKTKGYFAISFEIGFSTQWARRCKMRFSPLLGIGAPYLSCGEEDVFIYQALKKGAVSRFMDIVLGEHKGLPTLARGPKLPSAVRAAGAVIFLTYPATFLPRLLLKAKRLQGHFITNLYYLTAGVLYAMRNRKTILGE